MAWPTTLPDGKSIDRPELAHLEAVIGGSTGSTTAVLGTPGCGKSALLSTLARRYAERERPVLAIKGDMLDAGISNEAELGERLGLEARPSELLQELAEGGPVLLVLDQLDALAKYLDLRTARLNALLNLVHRLGGTKNIHIVLSTREFEFDHDSRLTTIDAEPITLELPPWSQVLEILEHRGVHAAGWPEHAQEVMRAPQALATYLKLKDRHGNKPFMSYQAMLDRLWKERVLEHDGGERRSQLATQIADRMADEETLWLANAAFEEHGRDIAALESAGILTTVDLKLGFTHQTLFDHALARNFVQERGRLSSYVLTRQVSLFVRPKMLAGLSYLRRVQPQAYHHEIEAIWNDPELRKHLRLLLIEFLGSQSDPTNREHLLMVQALRSPGERRRAYRALTGSPGWFERLSNSSIAESMSAGDKTTDQMVGVLERAWDFAPDDVLRLLEERWAPYSYHDNRTWWVLQSAPRWTDAALAMACKIVRRTEISPFNMDHVVGTIGVEQPEAALLLVRARLDHELEVAQAQSEQLAGEGVPEFDSIEEEVAWQFEKHPRIPLKELFEDHHGWQTLPALAERAPGPFLQVLWPWFEQCLDALAERSEESASDLEYALVYDADFRFESEAEGSFLEPALLAALRTAVEHLAATEPDEWLDRADRLGRLDLMPIQCLIAHSYTRAPERFSESALAFLLEDHRRFLLRSIHGTSEPCLRLVQVVGEHWSNEQIARFETAVNRYEPVAPNELTEAEQRREWNKYMRQIKLSLLQALPKHCLTEEMRRHIKEEERAFPRANLSAGVIGPTVTKAMMNAAAIARASDEDVIKAFRSVPDATGWRHPRDSILGGNIQLSREFADFSKENPERAIRLLRSLGADAASRASGYALEAMAEAAPSDQVIELLHDAVARGFDGDEFRTWACRGIQILVQREAPIGDDTVDILESWFARPRTDENASGKTIPRIEIAPAIGVQQAEDDEKRDIRHRSMLWGHGGLSTAPNVDSVTVETLIRTRLAREEHDRVDETLAAYLDRCKTPREWDRLLRFLPAPPEGRALGRAAFLDRLFSEVPDLVESKAAAFQIMNSRHWTDELADSQLDRWRDSESASARQTYGEIVAIEALTEPSSAWARTRLAALVADPVRRDARAGAALTAAHLWEHPKVRPGASDLLVELLADDAADVWKAVAELFRLNDELTPDSATIALLEVIAEKPSPVLRPSANFVTDRLATLIPHEPVLVGRVARSLILDWQKELGDTGTATAMAADELTHLAVNLHRIGHPETREIGMELFEHLLEIDLREARQTLDEIDSQFREEPAKRRPRLARRRKRRADPGTNTHMQ